MYCASAGGARSRRASTRARVTSAGGFIANHLLLIVRVVGERLGRLAGCRITLDPRGFAVLLVSQSWPIARCKAPQEFEIRTPPEGPPGGDAGSERSPRRTRRPLRSRSRPRSGTPRRP